MWLSCYACKVVPTEVDICHRFEEGLNDNMKLHIITLQIMNFSQIVEATLNVDRVRNSEQNYRDRQYKRGPGQFSSLDITSKRPRGSQSQSQ